MRAIENTPEQMIASVNMRAEAPREASDCARCIQGGTPKSQCAAAPRPGRRPKCKDHACGSGSHASEDARREAACELVRPAWGCPGCSRKSRSERSSHGSRCQRAL